MDGRTFGVDAREMDALIAGADLLINVSGGTLLRDAAMRCPRKVLIDTDPGWNHFRNFPRLDADPAWGGGHGYRAHDFFFTYAERIGQPDCVLPGMELPWQPTRPPVVLDQWHGKEPATHWTTIMTWKNHAETISYRDVRYGTKEMEFERVEALPQRVRASMQVAAGGTDRPLNEEQAKTWYPTRPRWEGLGWSVTDAHAISSDAARYRHYVEQSRAEFSVAKNVYVATRSGWFSCRSTCYLAAGKPVVLQDTGFSEFLPTGEGLLAFTGIDEAADAIEKVEADYQHHQGAARRMAEQHFASERVLGDLLRRIDLY